MGKYEENVVSEYYIQRLISDELISEDEASIIRQVLLGLLRNNKEDTDVRAA